MYKKSYYNYIKELGNKDVVLYNTRTGAVAVVEKNNVEIVENILKNPKQNTDTEFFSSLYDNGFIVDENCNEYENIKTKYENNFNSNRLINIVMLPIEMCNFSCPYCFIYNYKNKIMDDCVYNSIKKYIQNRIENSENNNKKINLKLTWFGGEPLLKKDKIFSYMSEIHEQFDKSCNIFSSIITNAYDLSYEVFSKLLKSGISNYQITFDGAKENHDILRKLNNGDGTFDTIIKNLQEIKNHISSNDKFAFAIRINFLRNTYKKIFGLIDDLFLIIGNDQRFNIYCRPIYNFETKRDSIKEVEDDIFTISDGLKVQNDFTRYIADKTNDTKEFRMINDYLPLPTISWCGEDNTYSTIIGSDASVYICDSLIGDESISIGKLNENGNIEYNEKSIEWKKSVFEFDNFSDCKQCKSLPICVGSCKRERIYGNSKPCLWTEEDIYKSMEKYYLANYN